jgi:hypothetical protein
MRIGDERQKFFRSGERIIKIRGIPEFLLITASKGKEESPNGLIEAN